jgi:hypothetical protein
VLEGGGTPDTSLSPEPPSSRTGSLPRLIGGAADTSVLRISGGSEAAENPPKSVGGDGRGVGHKTRGSGPVREEAGGADTPTARGNLSRASLLLLVLRQETKFADESAPTTIARSSKERCALITERSKTLTNPVGQSLGGRTPRPRSPTENR